MGHSNIYIRKENEITWESIGDKSKWVNDRLQRQAMVKKEIETPIKFESKFQQEYPKTKQEVEKVLDKLDKRPIFTGYLAPGKKRSDYRG